MESRQKVSGKRRSFDFLISLALALLLSYALIKGWRAVYDPLHFAQPTGVYIAFFKFLIMVPGFLIFSPLSLVKNTGVDVTGLGMFAVLLLPFVLIAFWALVFWVVSKLTRRMGAKSALAAFILPLLFVICANVFAFTYQPTRIKNYLEEMLEDPLSRAQDKGDFNICNQEENPRFRDSCFYSFATGVGGHEYSREACLHIINDELKASCSARVDKLIEFTNDYKSTHQE